jgi:hypothetical protein
MTFVRRLGWKLMGYPYKVGYGRFIFKPPLWSRVYRLGAWLHNL